MSKRQRQGLLQRDSAENCVSQHGACLRDQSKVSNVFGNFCVSNTPKQLRSGIGKPFHVMPGIDCATFSLLTEKNVQSELDTFKQFRWMRIPGEMTNPPCGCIAFHKLGRASCRERGSLS